MSDRTRTYHVKVQAWETYQVTVTGDDDIPDDDPWWEDEAERDAWNIFRTDAAQEGVGHEERAEEVV